MTFTKEQLIARARFLIKRYEDSLANYPDQDGVAMDLELARMALAGMKAEPVGFIARHKETGKFGSYLHPKADWFKNDNYEVLSAYAAPPAPVSVPEWTNEQCMEFLSIAFRHAEINGDLQLDDIRLGVKMVNGIRPAMLQGADGNSPVIPDCSCHTCRPVTISDMRFVVCPECGNKRCPHANDHRNACTGSNEPGQEGSAYPAAPQQEV